MCIKLLIAKLPMLIKEKKSFIRTPPLKKPKQQANYETHKSLSGKIMFTLSSLYRLCFSYPLKTDFTQTESKTLNIEPEFNFMNYKGSTGNNFNNSLFIINRPSKH